MIVNFPSMLLKYGTTSDGLPMRDGDRNIAMTIVDFLSTGEKTSAEIEQHVKRKHDDVDDYKVRSILFIMEENEISQWNMRVVPLPDRPMNKVCYCSLVRHNDETFSRIISGKIEAKVDRILANFIDGESQYFCKTKESNCTNGLIYTFSKMVENGNTCPSCGASLCEMDDDDKKAFIMQMISTIPSFIKKDRILQKMYSAILPNVAKIPPVTAMEGPPVSKPIDTSMFEVATFADAMMLINRVRIPPRDGLAFSVIYPGNGSALETAPARSPDTVPGSGSGGIAYFTTADVRAMKTRAVMMECFKRWLVAMDFAIDVLMKGRQSESRKKIFSMSKLFFFAWMGKKYLSKALVGIESREVFEKIDDAMTLMEKEGLMRVESFHPKFLPGGVALFTGMCRSGEVYHYAENAGKIESAEAEFWAINAKAPDRSKSAAKKFTVRVFDGAYQEISSFLMLDSVPVLPPAAPPYPADFFSVYIA